MTRTGRKENGPEPDFEEGRRLLEAGKLDKAYRALRRAYGADGSNPEYMSYFGLAAALRTGELGLAMELCTDAIKRDCRRADFYLNLGKVYMAAGNKKGALKALKRGLDLAPDNRELYDLLVKLGAREPPIIPFLKWSNPINVRLGVLFRRTIPDLFRERGPRHLEKEGGKGTDKDGL